MDSITWQVAIAWIGSLVALLAFLSKLIMSKHSKPWKDDVDNVKNSTEQSLRELEHRLTINEGVTSEAKRRIEEIREIIRDTSLGTEQKFEKIEVKLEKITQLIIDLLQAKE